MPRSTRSDHHRGQALLEFAILGSLALFALAFLIQIGLRVNFQQEVEQQTFRRTLAKADSYSTIEPVSVQYQEFWDRQVPSPGDGFAVMPRTYTEANATVVWGTFLSFTADQDRRSQPLTVVSVNGVERDFREEDFEGIPETAPEISRIDRRLTASGTVQQANATSSSLATNTTQTTTVTLKNNATVSGEVTSGVNWNW